jgi:hypothetical protein
MLGNSWIFDYASAFGSLQNHSEEEGGLSVFLGDAQADAFPAHLMQ